MALKDRMVSQLHRFVQRITGLEDQEWQTADESGWDEVDQRQYPFGYFAYIEGLTGTPMCTIHYNTGEKQAVWIYYPRSKWGVYSGVGWNTDLLKQYRGLDSVEVVWPHPHNGVIKEGECCVYLKGHWGDSVFVRTAMLQVILISPRETEEGGGYEFEPELQVALETVYKITEDRDLVSEIERVVRLNMHKEG